MSVKLEYCHTRNLNFIAVKLFLSAFALASAAQLPQTQARKSQQKLLTGDFFVVPGVNLTYDYVVVGGGTARLAIAYRLAADRKSFVEAGGFYEIENGNTSQVPGLDFAYDSVTASSQWATPALDCSFLCTSRSGK